MLILKSASPRRIQLFQDLGLVFQSSPSNIDESVYSNENFMDYLERITKAKLDISNATYSDTYISSDTIVVMDDKMYPKTLNFELAKDNLIELSGREHFVYSSIGISIKGQYFFDFDKTKVQFKKWTTDDIINYIDQFKPYDKAGSYGVQDKEGPVSEIQGSYSNVLGFPLRIFFQYLWTWREYI